MKLFSFLRTAVLAVILSACAPPPPQQADAPQGPTAISATVSKVIDGDTFALQGESRRIRIWGLDAPEWNWAGGPDATATMRQLVAGRRLQCQIRGVDRYGRIVAQCFLPDGRDIAAVMIWAGVASEYCRYSRGYYRSC